MNNLNMSYIRLGRPSHNIKTHSLSKTKINRKNFRDLNINEPLNILPCFPISKLGD